jgi:hypothetical protein
LSLSDVLSVAAILTSAGTLYLSYSQTKKQKPDLSILPLWGYYEDTGETAGTYRLNLYLEMYARNRGMRGTSVTRVLGTIPLQGGVIKKSEGKPTEAVLPLSVPADDSKLLKMTSDFSTLGERPRFQDNQGPTPLAKAIGFKGRMLDVTLAVIHTHGTEYTRYPAYPKDSEETKLNRESHRLWSSNRIQRLV